MSNDTVGIGIVGLRNIGMNHAKLAVADQGCRLVAVADTDPDRVAEGTRLGDGVRGYSNADDLFGDDRVDGVVLSVPNHLHAPLSVGALQAGKHVLVEKPMAMSTAEADEMIRARDASGRVLMVGMNQRFKPIHQAVKRKIDEGTIGEIYAAKTAWLMCRVHQGLWGRGDWFLNQYTAGGGPIIDLGVHRLDLALYLMGFPTAVSVDAVNWHAVGAGQGAARGKTYTIEDGGIGLIRFENGTSLLLEAAYFWNGVEGRLKTELAGTAGGALLAAECSMQKWGVDEPEPIALEPEDGVPVSCVEHFARVLHGRDELIPTAEQGRTGMRIMEAFYESAETGRQVRL